MKPISRRTKTWLIALGVFAAYVALALIVVFALKFHGIHGRPRWYFPASFLAQLGDEAKVQTLWWEGSFEARERFMLTAEELDGFLIGFTASAGLPVGSRSRFAGLRTWRGAR